MLELCGIHEDKIDEVVQLLSERSKIIICWAMGLTQHKNAVDNIKECVNLLLLKGSLGKPGAGTCPVRGHSNVQGDRSVGIMHYVSKELNASIENTFGFKPPEKIGLDTVNAIESMYNGKSKIFIALGGNFLSAASDTQYTAQALQNCSLTVNISTKLNRTHVIPGKTSIILPTLGRTELDNHNSINRFVTVENSMGKVHRSKGVLQPASDELKSEPEIIGLLADTFFDGNHVVPWKEMSANYDLIRDKIQSVLKGYDDLTNKSGGPGFYLPNNSRDLNFRMLHHEKAQFSICKLPQHKLKSNEFLLMTIRSHDQFNTTIYGLNDRYRGIFNERRVVFINKKDLEKLGLKKLDVVNVISRYDGKERKIFNFILVPYNIPQNNLACYFPEANPLVPYNHYADKSNTPISKSIVVHLEKTE